MSGADAMPPGFEAVLRSALTAAFEAGRKPGTSAARDRAVAYGIDRVALALIVGRAQEQDAQRRQDGAPG